MQPIVSLPGGTPTDPSMNVNGGLPNVSGTGAVQGTSAGGITGVAGSNVNGNISGAGGNQISGAGSTITPAPLTPSSPSNPNALTPYEQDQINQQNSIISIDKQTLAAEEANAPGAALTPGQLNLTGLQSAAATAAQTQVNPLYTQYLNEYNQSLATNQTAAQAENANNITAEQNQLGNTLAQNTQSQLYAGQQNAATQGNINAEAQNYQLNAGNAQTAKVQAIAGTIGSGNLGASGYGQQQLFQAENARNTADAQQQGQFQYQRNTSNLSTQDTFAQLAQSSLYAQQGANTSEAATNFNLGDYLRQASQNDQQYQNALSANQAEAVSSATQNNLATSLQNAINGAGLSGKNLAATEQAYGAQLSSVSNPGVLNQGDYLSGPNAASV